MNYGGTATLTDSTISGNSAHWGGGVYTGSYGHGITTLANCTISGNTASLVGGGVYTGPYGATTLTDSTVSGNAAGSAGGGLFSRASSTTALSNCTVSGNSASRSGGGLYQTGPATVNLVNTIVAGNSTASQAARAATPLFGTWDGFLGHNLIGDTESISGWVGSDLTGSFDVPLDPLLAPLANNGGPTQTMALLPGSPAIRAGTAVSGITTDQRGQPVDFPSPDIGAFQDSPTPVIVATAGGQFQGWLSGVPDTIYRIKVFASSSYNADGSGEEQDFLGSLTVATEAAGQVSFAIPFAAPAGLPVITATATDPQGNTTDVRALRIAVFQAPTQSVRDAPGQPVLLSAASGDAIALQDQDAGPLDPEWQLTLSVAGGTLTLGSTAGLTGSGDGTGSLSYSGPLSALNAALAGSAFTPLPGLPGSTQCWSLGMPSRKAARGQPRLS